MQIKLFDIPPMRIPRPTFDNTNFDEAYKEMASEIIDWENSEASIEDTIQELRELFDPHELSQSDGYELARELEREWGVDPDAELVNVLDGFSSKIYFEHRNAVRKWVQDCCITPKYDVGNSVKVKYKNKEYEGIIREIYKDTAEYSVFIEELGHVKEGSGTHGVIKKFEEVENDFFDPKHWTV